MSTGAGASTLQRLFERIWYPPQAAQAVAGLTKRSRRRLPMLHFPGAPPQVALQALEARLNPSSGAMGFGEISLDLMGAADSAVEIESHRIPAFAGPGENEVVGAIPQPASPPDPRDGSVFVGPGDNWIVSIEPSRPAPQVDPRALPVFFGPGENRPVAVEALAGGAMHFPPAVSTEAAQVAIAPSALPAILPVAVESSSDEGDLEAGSRGGPSGGGRNRPTVGEDGPAFSGTASEETPCSNVHPGLASCQSAEGDPSDAASRDALDVVLGVATGSPSAVPKPGEPAGNGERSTDARPETPKRADTETAPPTFPAAFEAGVEGPTVEVDTEDFAVLLGANEAHPRPPRIVESADSGAADSEGSE